MIHLIPIEPINDAHGALIVGAFNRLFVKDGGRADGWGDGYGGDGNGGGGYGGGYGGGSGGGSGVPKEWQVK